MEVARLSCGFCNETWHVPRPDREGLRRECRDCGSSLDVEIVEVPK